MNLIYVAIGGAVGSVLRYLMVQCVMRLHPDPFPFGTLCVNILGSLIIGWLMARFMLQDMPAARMLLVTGVLGGFTTFSAFSWDTLQLLQRGAFSHAALYVLGSLCLSFAAVAAGYWLAR